MYYLGGIAVKHCAGNGLFMRLDYIRSTMIRFVLALLAFMTGLAAFTAPAEARVGAVAGSEVGAVAGVAEVVVVRLAQAPAARQPTYRRVLIIAPLYLAAPAGPATVRTGIDRARE